MQDYGIVWDRNEMPAGASRRAAIANANKVHSDFQPTWDEIAKLAYFNYMNRGSRGGDDVQDWLEAETRLLSKHNSRGSRGLCGEV